MADTFFLRLSDGGTATWGAFDATGRLVGAIGHGGLDGAHAALANRRCTVLVSGVDVLNAQVELPAGSQARLRQIAPFSLEESMADDVERLVFAIGARLASGATQVAAVARERIDAWLTQLRAVGIAPQALCSEADGVPDVPSTLVLVIEGNRIAGREPGRPPFVFEGLGLRQVLDLVRGRVPDGEELRHIRIFADPAGRVAFAAELEALGDTFASADVKILGDGVFPYLAATLAQRAGTNLLQGPYAPRSNWLAMLRPWRLAACLVAVSVTLALLLEGAQYWQLRRIDRELTDAVATACQRVVGDPSTSGCQREVRQRLGARADGTGEDFLSTLAAIAALHDDATRIDALSYRNNQLDLQVVAPSVTALDEFSRRLEQTRRFDVELEATSQVDAGTEGRLRVVGVNP